MRLLIGLPLLLLLVLFALSNTAPVRLGLWPTDYALQLPLSLDHTRGHGNRVPGRGFDGLAVGTGASAVAHAMRSRR